jgi:hypothetical protein
MYSIVKRLRERGRRLHDRDISASSGVRGDLTLAICGIAPQANLSKLDDQQMKPVIPPLEHAQLITMHGDKMLFRGVERASDGAEYVQEWSVKVLPQP